MIRLSLHGQEIDFLLKSLLINDNGQACDNVGEFMRQRGHFIWTKIFSWIIRTSFKCHILLQVTLDYLVHNNLFQYEGNVTSVQLAAMFDYYACSREAFAVAITLMAWCICHGFPIKCPDWQPIMGRPCEWWQSNCAIVAAHSAIMSLERCH